MPPSDRHGIDRVDPRQLARTDELVAAMVGSGLVDPDRADQARAVVGAVLSRPARTQAPLRRRLAEVAGYVGGALVVGAAVVFLSEEWGSLTTTGRVSTLTVIGLLLFGAGLVVLRTGARAGANSGEVRRRLASALTSGAAVPLGFGAGVLADARLQQHFSEVPWLVGSVVALAVAAGGYLLAHSALGQLTLAGAALSAVAAAVALSDQRSELPLAFAFVGLGVVWLVLAHRAVWWERYVGEATGCALVLLGAQYPVVDSASPWVGYLLTAVAAVVGVWLYVRSRSLPYLVTAVAAITLVVPEALLDWTDGSLGPVGALLATGVTLLVASLLGLRLRQEVGTPAGPGATG